MKTETCKLYSRDFSIFLPNIIKIDHYNSEVSYTVSKLVPFFRHSVDTLEYWSFWTLMPCLTLAYICKNSLHHDGKTSPRAFRCNLFHTWCSWFSSTVVSLHLSGAGRVESTVCYQSCGGCGWTELNCIIYTKSVNCCCYSDRPVHWDHRAIKTTPVSPE